MARPVYAHELIDPDFSWLISSFQENNPQYMLVDASCLPVILIERGVPLGAELPALPQPPLVEGEGEQEVPEVE